MSNTAQQTYEDDTDRGLPEGWTGASLMDLCDLIRGVSYQKGEVLMELSPGFLPLLRANNINGEIVFNNLRYVPRKCVSLAQMLKVGDVVVAMSSGSKTVVGKGATLRKSWEGTFGAFCSALRPSRELDSQYFAYFFQTRGYRDAISEAAAGVNINNLRREYFERIEFPIAPLAEQKRIVAKVEELLARVNTTKERLSKASIILKRFRQSVLAAACSGRLTAAWREANSVHDDFVQTTVEEIVEYLGGFAYKSKTFLKRGVHQVIRIGNVRPISLILKASPAFISEHMAQQTERFKLLPDDIVISMTGTKYKKDYGYAAIVGDSDGNLFLNQRVARLRCGDRTLPKYLLYWLQTDTFRDFFFAGETGNVNQGNVGADGIRKAAIELPPLCEQHEIVRRVEAMFKLADAVEKRVGAAKVRAEKLTQAVLAKAFRGELVPTEAELTSREGRSYESASELLSRIKSETRIKGAVTKNS